MGKLILSVCYIYMKKIWSFLLLLLLGWGLVGCSGDRIEATPPPNEQLKANAVASKLSEVATPKIIQTLRDRLDRYHPEVSILSPQPDQVFDDTTVNVKLQVRDLPIFKNSQLSLGNHLHLVVDNEPVRSIYNLDEPFILDNLTAGTHTLRVFAVRPWDESFKNEGAFAQTTFHILTKTRDNTPDAQLPLLTYNSPSGVYGAEPIMLDFYLNNAPLHLVANQDPNDDVEDWRIRVTVNGEIFVLDNWQPVYLKGFKKGKNWVQIEYIDRDGQNIPNTFNNTVRTIVYDPNAKNTLAKLVENKLSLEVAQGIIEPTYTAPIVEPETEEIPSEVMPTTEVIVPNQESKTEKELESELSEEKLLEKPKAPEEIESNPVINEKQPEISTDRSVIPSIEPKATTTSEPTTQVEEKELPIEEKINTPSTEKPTIETTETPQSLPLPKIY
jgi:hypothetical protein